MSAQAPPEIPSEAWDEGAFTTAQAAEFLSVSPRTVFNYMASGRLRWAHLGRQRRIPKRDCVAALLRERCPEAKG